MSTEMYQIKEGRKCVNIFSNEVVKVTGIYFSDTFDKLSVSYTKEKPQIVENQTIYDFIKPMYVFKECYAPI